MLAGLPVFYLYSRECPVFYRCGRLAGLQRSFPVSKRRVVVTGLGQVSPVGNDVATGWANLLAGQSGIDLITRFDASDMGCHVAGQVKGFDATQYINPKDARRMDDFIHYGIAAAMQAITDSGLDDVTSVNVSSAMPVP